MIRPIALAGMCIVLALPGLARAQGGAPQADSVDACALFTREEVTALSNDAVRKPRTSTHRLGNVASSSCWYTTRNDSWSVKILVERGRSPEDMRDMVAALKRVAGQTTAVAGLGDEAFWGQIGPSNGQLHVVIGNDFVTVQTWGKAPGAGTLEKTRQLATTVVNRFKERYAGSP